MTRFSALAPAKVNLFLHVGSPDTEGYHPISSLVAFADVGDRLTAARSSRLSLRVDGGFAGALGSPGENLVLKALRALGRKTGSGEPQIAVTLDKVLPVAAGLGGGSVDAGAALRLAGRLADGEISVGQLADAAAEVGADGPMCLFPSSLWAEGRGERLQRETRLPALHAVLVNPRAPSPTGAVYKAYDEGRTADAARPEEPVDWKVDTVLRWLEGLRNDLQAPALALQPAIGPVLEAIAATQDVQLTRMSGSGATVFGLYREEQAAALAAERLAKDHGHWWVRQTVLGADLSAHL